MEQELDFVVGDNAAGQLIGLVQRIERLEEEKEGVGKHTRAVHSDDGRGPSDGLVSGGPEPRHSGGDVEDIIHIELGHFAAHDVDEQTPHAERKRLYIFDRAVERSPHARTKRKRD